VIAASAMMAKYGTPVDSPSAADLLTGAAGGGPTAPGDPSDGQSQPADDQRQAQDEAARQAAEDKRRAKEEAARQAAEEKQRAAEAREQAKEDKAKAAARQKTTTAVTRVLTNAASQFARSAISALFRRR